MTTRSYQGSCHCGAVRFRFTSEVITTGCRCNCSICRRKGAVMSSHYIARADFLLEGAEHLSCYRFGDHDVNHYFCKTCGIYPFHDGTATPGRYRVNLGCVIDVDPFTLQIDIIDSSSF